LTEADSLQIRSENSIIVEGGTGGGIVETSEKRAQFRKNFSSSVVGRKVKKTCREWEKAEGESNTQRKLEDYLMTIDPFSGFLSYYSQRKQD